MLESSDLEGAHANERFCSRDRSPVIAPPSERHSLYFFLTYPPCDKLSPCSESLTSSPPVQAPAFALRASASSAKGARKSHQFLGFPRKRPRPRSRPAVCLG